MLDGVGLVHMNGRVYDPVIGRFLSRDPLVDGRVSQGANGYAYVWNNPLTLNDPSGYEVSADDIKKQWEDAGGGRNEEVVVTASRLRLYLGSLAREYNGRLSDLTAALGPSTTDLADAGAGGGTGEDQSGGENEPLPQTQNPEACKSAANAPIGLAATNQVFRSNSDPNKRFTVNASLLTIRQTNSFNSNGRARGVVQGSNWAIFGSVTLQQNPGGSISLRPDRYDFEQNEVTTAEDLFRNIETYFGFYAATYGGLTEYWADLTGGNHATDFSFDFICQPTVVR
jgi:RHS repeat-associated protein